MARKIGPEIYQIQSCSSRPSMTDAVSSADPDWFNGDTVNMANCAYLINGEQTLLFDTVGPDGRELLFNDLDQVLGDQSLDYVVPSHPEAPHAGNTNAILRRYPDAELYCSEYGRGEELYYLDSATQVGEGDMLDLGGMTVEFRNATFPDTAFHIWLFEHTTKTLFTADWMGAVFTESERNKFADEIRNGMTVDRFMRFQGRALRWLQYCDEEVVIDQISYLINTYEPEIIAPSHGLVIRENTIEHMESMKDVVHRLSGGEKMGELA